MSQTVLPYTQNMRLKPRRVTGKDAEEACRVVRRSFTPTEIQQLQTNYPIRRSAQDDDTSSVAASASSLTDLLSAPAITDAVPLGTTIELTNLTIAADSPLRTLRISISSAAVDIDIAGADQDWVQARGREFRALFTPDRRPWDLRATSQRRDFVFLGLAVDAVSAAALFVVAPQGLLTSPEARLITFAALTLVPVVCWVIAGRVTRRCTVCIGATEPTGWWKAMDTMTKLTLGLFLAALLTIALDVAQNGLTGGDHAQPPHPALTTREDGIQ